VPVQVAGCTVIALLAATKSVRGRVATAVMWAVLLVPLAIRYVFMGPGDIVPTWLSVAMDGTGLNREHLLIAGVAIYRWSKKRMDRKSTRLNSSHVKISYAVFCLKKKS